MGQETTFNNYNESTCPILLAGARGSNFKLEIKAPAITMLPPFLSAFFPYPVWDYGVTFLLEGDDSGSSLWMRSIDACAAGSRGRVRLSY